MMSCPQKYGEKSRVTLVLTVINGFSTVWGTSIRLVSKVTMTWGEAWCTTINVIMTLHPTLQNHSYLDF